MNNLLSYPNHTTILHHQKGILKDGLFFIDANHKYLAIVDKKVYDLHHYLFDNLPNNVLIYPFVAKESNKSIDEYTKIIDFLLINKFNRTDEIIAIGGGITTDLALYVASTYKRGIKITLIPTTLLAMVDASIGGKCGINHNDFKNQIGTFYLPNQLIIDESFLDTLPNDEFNNGFSEIIKYAIIKDEEMFLSIEENKYQINQLIERCIKIKVNIVNEDLYDNNIRKILNFGHTYGHMVESHSKYQISHGHSVAIGMVKELVDENLKNKVMKILQTKFDLNYQLTKNDIRKYLAQDKKMEKDTIDVVHIDKIGHAKVIKKKVEDLIDEYIW